MLNPIDMLTKIYLIAMENATACAAGPAPEDAAAAEAYATMAGHASRYLEQCGVDVATLEVPA